MLFIRNIRYDSRIYRICTISDGIDNVKGNVNDTRRRLSNCEFCLLVSQSNIGQ